MTEPLLFTPLTLGGVALKNRIVVSPMCQYAAVEGVVQDWHLAHLGRFAIGGAAAVFVEATAVSPEGRISHGDVGLWNEEQARALARVADFVRAQGAAPAIQLAHAGRKGSTQRPWDGGGPVGEADRETRGETPWETMAPSAAPFKDDWIRPSAMTAADIAAQLVAWREATARAAAAGFDIVEVHAAHGYLLNQFLSPLSNFRDDAYGGDGAGRMRFPLEVVETVRAVWPDDKPVFVRISSVDGPGGGVTLDDSVAFARELKARGVEVVDCSSGGVAPAPPPISGPGYQVPYAGKVKAEAGIRTMAVGLITDPHQAETILQKGQADLICMAREMLADPNWPVRARKALGVESLEFITPHMRFWLNVRDQANKKYGIKDER